MLLLGEPCCFHKLTSTDCLQALVREWRRIVEDEQKNDDSCIVVLPTNGHSSESRLQSKPLKADKFSLVGNHSKPNSSAPVTPPLITVDCNDDLPNSNSSRITSYSVNHNFNNELPSKPPYVSTPSISNNVPHSPDVSISRSSSKCPSPSTFDCPVTLPSPLNGISVNGTSLSPSSKSNVSNKRFRRSKSPEESQPLQKRPRNVSPLRQDDAKGEDSDCCEIIEEPVQSLKTPKQKEKSKKKSKSKESKNKGETASPSREAVKEKRGRKRKTKDSLIPSPAQLVLQTSNCKVKTTSQLVAELAQRKGDSLLAEQASRLEQQNSKSSISSEELSRNKIYEMNRFMNSLPGSQDFSRKKGKSKSLKNVDPSSRTSTPLIPITPSPPPEIVDIVEAPTVNDQPISPATTTLSSGNSIFRASYCKLMNCVQTIFLVSKLSVNR